jgi:imidazolonepropionase-like amidohydrolase
MKRTPLFLALLTLTLTAGAFAQNEGPPKILFQNVNVFDGVSETLQSVDVLVEGNLIKEVGSGINADGAQVVDGGGRTLMP